MRNMLAGLSMLFMCAGDIHAAEIRWDYEGDAGPEAWGRLHPDYALCASGRNQSPIDIGPALTAHPRPLDLHYPTAASDIVFPGHTVQINFRPGNVLTLEDGAYTLRQIHFHAPGENRIRGEAYPLEAHFVHADDKGNLAVIAVLFRQGRENSVLKKLWQEFPAMQGAAVPLRTAVTPAQLLPADKSYYRYSGSLTTPPCSEGVRWIVLRRPLSISPAQIDAFGKFIRHSNSRPVQPMNGRLVVQ
jgi:carbonic anhydrase